jgi:transcriptional regulator with XRE-family HTH domain
MLKAVPPKERSELIRARELLGLSRPELAKKIGIHRSVVFKVEMGSRAPSLELMTRWTKALGRFGTLELFRYEDAA